MVPTVSERQILKTIGVPRGGRFWEHQWSSESAYGVAIRFLNFADDGAQQLQTYMEGLTTEQDPDLLTDVATRLPEGSQLSPKKAPATRPVRKSTKPEEKIVLEFE